MIRTPMKPATLSNISDVVYPCYTTPKFDGIRCCIQDYKALTYNLKSIPNHHVRSLVESLPNGVDGELVSNDFNSTQSAITTHGGEPKFTYCIFDLMPLSKNLLYIPNYLERIDFLLMRRWPKWVKIVKPTRILNQLALVKYESKCVEAGYEGVILRTDAPYKYGRSTLREFGMVKWKRFADTEGIIIGFKERISKHGEPLNTLGALIVKTKWGEVKVGGFTAALAKEIWTHKKSWLGKRITFLYQEHGMKNKPRFGRFKGIRKD